MNGKSSMSASRLGPDLGASSRGDLGNSALGYSAMKSNPSGRMKDDRDLSPTQQIEDYKSKGKIRRAQAGRSALADETLRSIYDTRDITKLSASKARLGNPDLTTQKMEDILDRTIMIKSQVQNLTSATNDRLRHLKYGSPSALATEPLYRSVMSPIEADIREENDRLDQEQRELLQEKQQYLVEMKARMFGQEASGLQQNMVSNTDRGMVPSLANPNRGNGSTKSYLDQNRNEGRQVPIPENSVSRAIVIGGQMAGPIYSAENNLAIKRQQMKQIMETNEDLARKIQEKKEALTSWKRLDRGQGLRGPLPPFGPNSNRPEVRRLVQNSSRNPDLNDFERTLVYLGAQDDDEIRLMMGLPVGTDLYRYKAEQFKDTSTTRGEVQKLVYEQFLKAMKKGNDIEFRDAERRSENLLWDDEQRKNLLAGLY